MRIFSFGVETKSPKEGPLLSRSVKAVAARGVEDVVVAGGVSEIVVAKLRFWGITTRAWERRQRDAAAGRRAVAMAVVGVAEWEGGVVDSRLYHKKERESVSGE